MENKVKVEIFGQTYLIKTDVDIEYIKILANYVDSKMKEISRNYKLLSPLKIAILAALFITEELFKLKEEKLLLERTLEQKTSSLLYEIDKFLEGINNSKFS